MANLDWSQCPAVETVPGKVSGARVLKSTRMPVSAIFENLEAGANLDDIMEWYDGLDRNRSKLSSSLPHCRRATIPNTEVKPRLREITRNSAIKVIDFKTHRARKLRFGWRSFDARP